MAFTFTASQSLQSKKPGTITKVDIKSMEIDFDAKVVYFKLKEISGSDEYDIPGQFVVKDVAAAGDESVWVGGKEFKLGKGVTSWTTLMGADHAGADLQARLKTMADLALSTVYKMAGTRS